MKPVAHTGSNDDQKFPSDQKHIQKISHEDEQKFMNVGQHFEQEGKHRLRNIDHDIPLASSMDYAGITDKTRVRKPPGGDTNDIFDLESRQKSQAETKQMNLNSFMDTQGHYQANSGMSNLQDHKNKTCFSDTPHLNPDHSFAESPLFQMDKENLHLHSNASGDDILKKKALDDEEESKQPPNKTYLVRNPITGEVSEMRGSTCSKMSDCSNVVSNPNVVVRNPELNRPCVRVRQPPGGVSSNIF